jgi:hypothetical protein
MMKESLPRYLSFEVRREGRAAEGGVRRKGDAARAATPCPVMAWGSKPWRAGAGEAESRREAEGGEAPPDTIVGLGMVGASVGGRRRVNWFREWFLPACVEGDGHDDALAQDRGGPVRRDAPCVVMPRAS